MAARLSKRPRRAARKIVIASLPFALASSHAAGATPPTPLESGSAATFSLALTPLGSQISWSDHNAIVASATVIGAPATALIANVVLTDESTARQLGNADFDACANVIGRCQIVTTLPANSTSRVYLRPRASDAPSPGKYAGSIQLIAKEGKSDSAPFTVDVTSLSYQIAGILLVAFGTVLSLLTTVCVRNRLARKQMLLAAAAIRRRIADIERDIPALKPPTEAATETAKTAGLVRAALSTEQLDKASLLPRLWSIDAESIASSPNFKTRIDTGSAWALVLSHIVTLGFKPLVFLDDNKPAGTSQTAVDGIRTTWKTIDALARSKSGAFEQAPDLAGVDADIEAALKAARSLMSPIGGGVGRATEEERLNMQINLLSFAGWAIAAMLTIMVGSYVMVISHLDFGRPTDLWLCLFWGLGLPTVTQLSQATPSTVAANVGVILPK